MLHLLAKLIHVTYLQEDATIFLFVGRCYKAQNASLRFLQVAIR